MNTLEELLEVDPRSPDMMRAEQLAANDRALLRNLVQVRKDRGLTQQQVADILGVTQASISRFEAYDSNPTLASIRRYAHAVEALVNHDVEPDRGQLLDPDTRSRWVETSVSFEVHTISTPAVWPIRRIPSGSASFPADNMGARSCYDLALAA